jgi:hypothetical protein
VDRGPAQPGEQGNDRSLVVKEHHLDFRMALPAPRDDGSALLDQQQAFGFDRDSGRSGDHRRSWILAFCSNGILP